MSALLDIDGLVKHFPLRGFRPWLAAVRGGPRPVVRAVDGVSLRLAAGETVGLVGESGCGKSTVARCVVRLVDPTAGRVCFDGADLASLPHEALRRIRRDVQMVFQDPTASLNPRLTVRRTVEEPVKLHSGLDTRARKEAVREVLDRVGLGLELLGRYPHELSGGQRQRVNLARAIATHPRFVVLDEPTSALDVSLRAKIIVLLGALREELGMTYLFISHDLASVKYLAHRVAVMYLGTIVEEASTPELFKHPLHPYTRALLSAVPVPDPDAVRDRLRLAGEVTSATAVPVGCRLRGRCPVARAVCAEPIALREVAPGHRVACHLV